MSVADYILTAIINIFSGVIDIFPNEYSILPIADFKELFSGVAVNFSAGLNMIDIFAPWWLIVSVIIIIISAEFLLLGFRGLMAVINFFRGSGS